MCVCVYIYSFVDWCNDSYKILCDLQNGAVCVRNVSNPNPNRILSGNDWQRVLFGSQNVLHLQKIRQISKTPTHLFHIEPVPCHSLLKLSTQSTHLHLL
jgi:hypothetical protein